MMLADVLHRCSCSEKNRFLPQQNLSDQSCYFLDRFSWLRKFLDKILKIYPESPGNELSDYVFKILYVVCSPNGNIKCPANSFLEKDEIMFHLAARQCEGGGEGHTWDSAHAFCVKSTASEG